MVPFYFAGSSAVVGCASGIDLTSKEWFYGEPLSVVIPRGANGSLRSRLQIEELSHLRGQSPVRQKSVTLLSTMPLYRFELCYSLASSQQDELAKAVTKIHSGKFTTPSLFVNVTFTDISSQAAYIAGKRVSLTSGSPRLPVKYTLLTRCRSGPRIGF